MKEAVQGRAPVLNTALESSWPRMAASLESLTDVQVLTVTVTTHAMETIAKGSSELLLSSLNLVWRITGGPIPSKHICAHTQSMHTHTKERCARVIPTPAPEHPNQLPLKHTHSRTGRCVQPSLGES